MKAGIDLVTEVAGPRRRELIARREATTPKARSAVDVVAEELA